MGAKVYLKSGDIINYENVVNVIRYKNGTITISYVEKGKDRVAVFLLENIIGYEW